MDINRSNLTELFELIELRYTAAFAQVERTVLDSLAMLLPSTTAVNRHAWLNQIPQVREWLGDRLVQNIESNVGTVTNKKFESTIEMPREDIEDDQWGIYLPLADMMGANVAAHPDESLVDHLVANENWIGDTTSFFNDSRTYGSNTIDNTSTTALDAAEFNTAYQTMTSYLGHNNQPLGVRPTFLLYGPALRNTVFGILNNDFVAGGSVQVQNVNKGLVTPIMSTRLVGTNANRWFLFGEVAGIKGLAWQDRMQPEFQSSRTQLDSDFVFETDKFQFGTRSRGAPFLTLPHLIWGGLVA